LPIPAKVRFTLGALVFALVVFHCFFTGLDRCGFLGPDEPRYASIARDMALTGDWVTPRLNGVAWFEKPPLYYWSAAIGFRLFSSPEIAARTPSGVFALCAVLVLAFLAKRLNGASTAFAVAMMLPATVGMMGFARAAATDMPFAACLTLAMCASAYLLLEDAPAYPRICSAAFGVVLALAVLAKGPAAILLVGGSTALWAVASGNIARTFRLLRPTATLSFLAVVLPWYWQCAERNRDFLRVFFLEHNVDRFLTNRYQHQQPFWFFLPILLLAVFPWTLLLVPAVADGWHALRKTAWRKSPSVFFVSWVLFPLVFFSASQSKLPGYILPAVPPLVLLLARAISHDQDITPPARRTHLLWVALAFAALGFGFLLRDTITVGPRSAATLAYVQGLSQPLMLVGISLLVGGLAVAVVSKLQDSALGLSIAAFTFSIAVGIAANHVLPVLDRDISPRQLAFAAREAAPNAPLAVHNLPRSWQYGAEFYLERTLPEWSPEMLRPVWVLTSEKRSSDLPRESAPGLGTPRIYGGATIVRVE